MKKEINENKAKRVSTVIAFRMMQSVYSPLMKFFKEMVKNDCTEYIDMYFDYLNKAIVNMHQNKMDYFVSFDKTYTLNVVSKDICYLYGKYYHKTGDAFYQALERLFYCVLSDSHKYLEDHPCSYQ